MLRLSSSNGKIRVFRNSIGVDVSRGQPIRYGIPGPGGSDLLGWRTVKITQDMVGQEIAQFAAVEIKTPIGRLSPEQINFIRVVKEAGGLAVVARSVRDAESAFGLA